ncbi:MAG: hypothetical protein IJ007_04365, partial [Oscillospiraceae bacterium]|nr:hypothetical protein [Oscillospiraceae bacterium]
MKIGALKRIVSAFLTGAFAFSSLESIAFAQTPQAYDECKNGLEPICVIELSEEDLSEVIRKIDEAYSGVDVILDEKDSLYKHSTDYYYNQLDEKEKQLYDSIVESCEKFAASTIDIEVSSSAGGYLDYAYYDGTSITESEMIQIFHAVYYSNPQFYFLANGYGLSRSGTENAVVVPIADGSGDNFCLYSTRKEYSEKIEEVTNEWMTEINACDTPLEKETLISEKICDYITYEKTGFHQSLAGALVGTKCVCNGYAMAMSYFCNASGIDCVTVVSSNHAWNRVNLYDNWYEVDTTWMDQDDHIWYDWFNKSETSFTSAAAQGMHDIDTSYYENMFTLPSCTRDSVSECEHSGGTATCINKAVCGICEAEYGEVDSTNHVNKSTEWSKDETGHWYTCDCGKVDFAEHISGGEATETEDELCTTCGYVIAPATGHIKHTADTSKWLSDGTNHWYKCIGCDEKLNITTHSGGTATCTDKAVCGICEAEYGTVDNTNHVNKSAEWSKDETGHWYTCDCGKVDFSAHISGGEATETEDEVCTTCGYVIAPATGHIKHTADISKWLSDGINHWHKCVGCDEKMDITPHSGGTATCTDKAKCEICKTEYGEVDSTNHVNKSTEWNKDETGHWYTCDCGKVDFSAHISGGEA